MLSRLFTAHLNSFSVMLYLSYASRGFTGGYEKAGGAAEVLCNIKKFYVRGSVK